MHQMRESERSCGHGRRDRVQLKQGGTKKMTKTFFCEGCEIEGEWCELEIPSDTPDEDKPRFCPISGAKCNWHDNEIKFKDLKP